MRCDDRCTVASGPAEVHCARREGSVSDDPDVETVAGLLDDEYARAILTATSTEPMTATALSDRIDASLSTAYRRTNRLVEVGLLDERTRPRADGHHDTVYTATLDRVEVRLRDGELTIDIERERSDLADGLTSLRENLRDSTRSHRSNSPRRSRPPGRPSSASSSHTTPTAACDATRAARCGSCRSGSPSCSG